MAQLGSQHRWKTIKSSPKMSSIFEKCVSFIFYRLLLPTSRPGTTRIFVFPKEQIMDFPKIILRWWNRFWTISEPTWVHLSSKNHCKSIENTSLKSIEKLIGFWIDLGSVCGGQEAAFVVRVSCVFDGFALKSGSVRLLVLNFPWNIIQNWQWNLYTRFCIDFWVSFFMV